MDYILHSRAYKKIKFVPDWSLLKTVALESNVFPGFLLVYGFQAG